VTEFLAACEDMLDDLYGVVARDHFLVARLAGTYEIGADGKGTIMVQSEPDDPVAAEIALDIVVGGHGRLFFAGKATGGLISGRTAIVKSAKGLQKKMSSPANGRLRSGPVILQLDFGDRSTDSPVAKGVGYVDLEDGNVVGGHVTIWGVDSLSEPRSFDVVGGSARLRSGVAIMDIDIGLDVGPIRLVGAVTDEGDRVVGTGFARLGSSTTRHMLQFELSEANN
jgi:hypothetical protein